jgi:hypothetical protein
MQPELEPAEQHPTPAALPLDVRCPVDPRLLFFKALDGEVEVACRNCRDRERRTNHRVMVVLHRYSTATWECVATQVLELIPKN